MIMPNGIEDKYVVNYKKVSNILKRIPIGLSCSEPHCGQRAAPR